MLDPLGLGGGFGKEHIIFAGNMTIAAMLSPAAVPHLTWGSPPRPQIISNRLPLL
jgi:hypothetical protein